MQFDPSRVALILDLHFTINISPFQGEEKTTRRLQCNDVPQRMILEGSHVYSKATPLAFFDPGRVILQVPQGSRIDDLAYEVIFADPGAAWSACMHGRGPHSNLVISNSRCETPAVPEYNARCSRMDESWKDHMFIAKPRLCLL